MGVDTTKGHDDSVKRPSCLFIYYNFPFQRLLLFEDYCSLIINQLATTIFSPFKIKMFTCYLVQRLDVFLCENCDKKIFLGRHVGTTIAECTIDYFCDLSYFYVYSSTRLISSHDTISYMRNTLQ